MKPLTKEGDWITETEMVDSIASLTAIYWHTLVTKGLTRKEATKITVAWVVSMGGKGEGEASK